jgi:hypothetical protein
MGVVSSFLKPLKESIKYRLRWRYLWKDWFLGRHACLGYDVLKYFENLPKEVNFQKGRADLLIQYWHDKSLLPQSNQLSHFMGRDDVLPLIRQLEFFDCLPKRPPKLIFMDSFAELTDQLFLNRSQGWQFCCGYSDLAHDAKFSSQYDSLGLLPLDELKNCYLKLFDLFEERWGICPIYFLFFPIALETRQLFIDRHIAIVNAIHEIAKSRPHLHPIAIDESLVAWPKNMPESLKTFPYHYDETTYVLFKEKIGKSL